MALQRPNTESLLEAFLKDDISSQAIQVIQSLRLSAEDISHLPYSALRDEGVSLRDFAKIRKVLGKYCSLVPVTLLYADAVEGIIPSAIFSKLSKHPELKVTVASQTLSPLAIEEFYRCHGGVVLLDSNFFSPRSKKLQQLVLSLCERSKWVVPVLLEPLEAVKPLDNAGILFALPMKESIRWHGRMPDGVVEEVEDAVLRRVSSSREYEAELKVKSHATPSSQSVAPAGSLFEQYTRLVGFVTKRASSTLLCEEGATLLQEFNALGKEKEYFLRQRGLELVRNSSLVEPLLRDADKASKDPELFLHGVEAPTQLVRVLTCLWILFRDESNKRLAHKGGLPRILEQLLDLVEASRQSGEANETKAEATELVLSELLIVLQNFSHGFVAGTAEVGDRGMLQRVVATLIIYNESDNVVSHALGCLWCLTADDENKRRMLSADGIPTLVTALFAKLYSPEILAKGFAAVWNLSLDHHLKETMHKQNVETLICESIRRHPNETLLLAKAFGALWNMTVRPEDRQTAVEAGAIDLCLDVARRYFADKAVLAQVVGALKNITCDQGENKKVIADKGGIPLLLDIISRYPQDLNILVQAMGSLWNLSGYAPNKLLIVEEGGLELILDTLARYLDQEVLCVKCLASLWNLSSQEQIRPRIGRSVAPKLICEAMRRHRDNQAIVVKALASLWNTSSTEENKIAIARHGAIEAIADALDRFKTTEDVVIKCLAAFWNLSSVQDYKSVIAKVDGIPKIVEAMRNFSRHRVILVKALASLWNLSCDHHDNKKVIFTADGIKVICTILETNMNLDDVVLKSWGALHNLASEDFIKEQLMTIGAVSLLRTTLQHHRRNKRIFLCARDCGRRLYLFFSPKERQEFDLLVASIEASLDASS